MPLGILESGGLPGAARNSSELLDLSGVTNYEETLRVYLQSSDATGIRSDVNDAAIPATSAIAALIRTIRPVARILLGGLMFPW